MTLFVESKPLVVVLEDDEGRRAAMGSEIGALSRLHFFGGVPGFEEFVRTHKDEIYAISLDHDLILPQANERMLTPDERKESEELGNGVIACEKILGIYQGATLPNLVIHTSNPGRRYAMFSTLGVTVPDDLPSGQHAPRADGSPGVTVVYPANDLEWVSKAWGPAMRELFTPANSDSKV